MKDDHLKCESYLLCKPDEVLVVGVHVGELAVDQHHDLVLALGLLLPDVGSDNPLRLLLQQRISVHLKVIDSLKKFQLKRLTTFHFLSNLLENERLPAYD